MTSAILLFRTWLRASTTTSERGASLIEYALLIAFIAIVCVLAVELLGTSTSTSFSKTAPGFS